jgi:osmotically inducible lipoprotein OsmB
MNKLALAALAIGVLAACTTTQQRVAGAGVGAAAGAAVAGPAGAVAGGAAGAVAGPSVSRQAGVPQRRTRRTRS